MAQKIRKKDRSREVVASAGQGVQTILSEMSEGVVVENEHYQIEYMNQSLIERFGNCVGQKCYRAFIGRQRPCPKCSVKEIIHKGKKRFEYTAHDVSGRSYELVATPLRRPDGSVWVIEVVRDITEKIGTENQLKEAKRFYEVLLHDISEIVLVLRDRRVIWCNHRAEEVFGYSRDELLGRTTARLFSSTVEYQAFVKKAYRSLGRSNRYNNLLSLKTRKGETLHIELSLSARRREEKFYCDATEKMFAEIWYG